MLAPGTSPSNPGAPLRQLHFSLIDGLLIPKPLHFWLPEHPGLSAGSTHPPIRVRLNPLADAEIADHCLARGVHPQAVAWFDEHRKRSSFFPPTRFRQTFLTFRFDIPAYRYVSHVTQPATRFFLESARLFFGVHMPSPLNFGVGGYPPGGYGYPSATPPRAPEVTFTCATWRRFKSFLSCTSRIRQAVGQQSDLAVAHRYIIRALETRATLPVEDRMLFLTIALEAMMSPSSDHELRHRVTNTATWFLRELESVPPENCCRVLSAAYDLRSAVAHGAPEVFKRNKLSALGFAGPMTFAERYSFIVRELFVRRAIMATMDPAFAKPQVRAEYDKHARGSEARIPSLGPEPYVAEYVEPGVGLLGRFSAKFSHQNDRLRAHGKSNLTLIKAGSTTVVR